MIILLKDRVNEKQVANLTNWLEHSGFQLHISKGAHQTIIGLIGDTSRVDIDLISSLDIVESVKAAYTGEAPIKTVDVYVKPEEGKAYYVVNGDVTGAVEL